MSTTQSTTRLDLEHILSPTSSENFFHETWEANSLHVERNDKSHYAGLLSLRDVDQIIAFCRPQFADPSAFQKEERQGSTYVRGLLADQACQSPPTAPGIAELRQVFDQGKSVVIMGMQQRWPSVAELCRNLEAVFHCPVHANMYLTPAGSQAFAAHFDPHEVFILQLEGAKHWRLYDRTELLPLASDKSGTPALPLGAAREVCLKPGDLLYIPRGHVHDAYTTDTFSLHLTVGVNVYRWVDLLQHALTCASRQESKFRESIPGGALPASALAEGAAGLKRQFKQLLARLSDGDCDRLFDNAAGSLADQFFAQLPMLPGTQFSSQADLEQIELDTVLEKHAQAICRVVEKDGGVAIEFPGNRVGGPQRIASALRFIARAARFAVRDLPDELNAQAKVVLARRLVREGLLAPVARLFWHNLRIDKRQKNRWLLKCQPSATRSGLIRRDTPPSAEPVCRHDNCMSAKSSKVNVVARRFVGHSIPRVLISRRQMMQATIQQGSWQKQWGMLVAEVWADEDLKQRLISDPATVLQEYGIDVPADVELKMVADTDQVRHLVIPASPSDDLLDEDLTSSPSMYCFLCGGCGGCGCGSRRCGCDANS